ncbi:hypothetical protein IJ579_07765 [bacterium]|nr:hypothetical protein [bacterium]
MKIEVDKNFVKLGRSWGMIIPPWFFQVLNIDPKTDKATLSIENDSIVIKKQ